MKRLSATIAIFVLSSGLALAQSTFEASSTTRGTNPTTIPSPSNDATVGRAPGMNPSNSQDLTNRANPQDLTLPGSSNPQDLSTPGNR
jgi:hypothetical protein